MGLSGEPNQDKETERLRRIAQDWAAMDEESPDDLPSWWQDLLAKGRDKIAHALEALREDLRKDGPLNFKK